MEIAVLVHALLFLVFWLTNLPYVTTLNNFLIGATGLRVNYLMIFMVFAGLVSLWSGLRLVKHQKRVRSLSARLHLAVGIFFLIFFYASFAILFVKNPVQLYRLGQMFQYFRIFVDAGILLIAAWALPGWIRQRLAGRGKVVGIAGFLLLWLIPVITPPGNIYRGQLPEKPKLIAHRGAATLAPENTIASMQVATDLGVYGLETDIAISSDGVLFLMHDSTLSRTTDIARVFPEREKDQVDAFTWEELSRLDAGTWFDEKGAFSGEAIPALTAMIPIVKENNLYFIYDLRIPSEGHPYADQTLNLCLDAIQTAGLVDHTWVLVEPEDIEQIHAILPDAILAYGIGYGEKLPSPDSLVTNGYGVVNSVYGISVDRIHAYQHAGLWVNLWVVDEPWQYSRIWLAGIDSVTSNVIQVFLAMSRPVMALPYPMFLVLWSMIGLFASGVCFWNWKHRT